MSAPSAACNEALAKQLANVHTGTDLECMCWEAAAELRRLAAVEREREELAKHLASLQLAAMDADTWCWGPCFKSSEHAATYAKSLRSLTTPWAADGERTNGAWPWLDNWRNEAKEEGRKEVQFELSESRARVAELEGVLRDLHDGIRDYAARGIGTSWPVEYEMPPSTAKRVRKMIADALTPSPKPEPER